MQTSSNFIDFCSGIGAGRLGLELAGFHCIAHSEIDEDANRTYECFFADKKNIGDLTKIEPKKIPDCSLIIAGFPCQTFSIVGKRQGFQDTRGQIIYHLADILKEKQIPYFILENVKGLVNHNSGKTIASIITLLADCGYHINYKILNSVDYGVPQLRERVYFIGIRKDLFYKPLMFNECNINSDIKNFLINQNNEELDINNKTFQKYLNNKYNKGKFNIQNILEKDFLVLDTRQSDLRLYENKCPTLRTGRHGILYIKNKKLYKLSGTEALLLQGFPYNYVQKAEKQNISNTKLLSQAGNAMTVNVIQHIGSILYEYINGEKYEHIA